MARTFHIPEKVQRIGTLLAQHNHEAYLVGGCVRDLILGREPKDFDIATEAHPEEVVRIFEVEGDKVVCNNAFGTVQIVHEDEELTSPLRTVEITTYRSDGSYSDHRRPDSVSYSTTIQEDLSRRDFTINALALSLTDNTEPLIDLFEGLRDLGEKIIKTVGNPSERFNEDALRILRGARLAIELQFSFDPDTFSAMQKLAPTIAHISKERVRDEFVKIMMSDRIKEGIELLYDLGILTFIAPELAEGRGVDQSRNHVHDVWTHNLLAGQHAGDEGYPLHIRLASLMHDIGKPATRRYDKQQRIYTFYGHEVVGAKMVKRIMQDLRFSKEMTDAVHKLVRHHMFFSDTEQITLSPVRRMIRNVGKDLIWDLMRVRRCDRKGMGRPKVAPFRLRKYESMIEEALRDPISVGMLKIDGTVMVSELGFTPGPRMGWVLHALLDEVLDDPAKNTEKYLRARALDLNELDDTTLKALGDKGKGEKDKKEDEEVQKLRKKHHVT